MGLTPLHPAQALHESADRSGVLPVCDHYAGSERFLQKALGLQAQLGPVFDVTADLEDGAQVGDEANRAKSVGALINSALNRHRRLGVRIHPIGHPHWRQDLERIARAGAIAPAYVTLPKVQTTAQAEEAQAAIQSLWGSRPAPCPALHALIEDLEGVANAPALAALPFIECLSFGLMDFVSSFGGAIGPNALHSPGQFSHPIVAQAKLAVSMAAHRFGKTPSHSVTTALSPASQAGADATRALHEFGYTRMWSIHPDQITPIVRALSPSHAEVEQAADLLVAAQNEHWGPIRFGDRLHDRASYRLYWNLLRRAQAIGMPIPNPARNRFFGESP